MSAPAWTRRVTLLCAPAPVGGLESAVASLAAALAARGVAVQLIQLLEPGMRSPDVFVPLAAAGGVRLDALHAGRRSYRREARAVRALMQQHGSDVLHSHGERADLVSLGVGRATRRRVSTVHGFVVNNVRAQLVKAVHLQLLRRMDHVVAVSEALGGALGRMYRDRLVVLPNAIADRPPVDRVEARERLGIDTTSPVIGWVGRLSPEKRPQHFLDALRQLDRTTSCHALVVGDGPLAPALRDRVQASGLGDRVRFAGSVPDAGALMAAFDLLVLSSATEGTPMTVLEAMQAGVPVVSTAVGGVPAMLGEDAGWLVPPDDVAALADAMRHALGDAAERARRRALARQRLRERFSVATWAMQHERLYGATCPSCPR